MIIMRPLPVLVAATLLAACNDAAPRDRHDSAGGRTAAPLAVARDTVVELTLEAAGRAEPVQRAALSTRLMGTVLEVHVREGQRVAEGQLLLRIDARDLEARHSQIAAQLGEARAVQREAQTQAGRMRRLFADSVATRAQLDAAETGLARADAAVRLAEAAAAEVAASAAYAELRAPFGGTVTRRLVDPGAFASPGMPLLEIEDASRLRIAASAAPDAVRPVRAGMTIAARIEDSTAQAVVEGLVPAAGGLLWEVNAVVANATGRHLAHSAAVLLLPQGRGRALVVPAAAIRRDGEIASVRIVTTGGQARRMVTTGRTMGSDIEILSGLVAGDTVVLEGGR